MRERQVNDYYLQPRRRNHHHCRRHLHCHRDRQLNIPFRNLHLVIIDVAFVIITVTETITYMINECIFHMTGEMKMIYF